MNPLVSETLSNRETSWPTKSDVIEQTNKNTYINREFVNEDERDVQSLEVIKIIKNGARSQSKLHAA